jgi:hypothetical protein
VLPAGHHFALFPQVHGSEELDIFVFVSERPDLICQDHLRIMLCDSLDSYDQGTRSGPGTLPDIDTPAVYPVWSDAAVPFTRATLGIMTAYARRAQEHGYQTGSAD